MMKHIALLAVLTLTLTGASPARADTDDAHARTERHELQSAVLGETREIYVRVPPRYDASKTYPVIYVLDGEWNFEFAAAYLDYMMDNEVYPDVIVTGVRNVNRNRDYVPAPDPNFPHTGEADRFLDFTADEWIPFVENGYPASGKRAIVGHSFGGVFTLHAFFTRPGLFDAYIALGSSAWIADRVLFNEADALFSGDDIPPAFVYMAVGEGDGGPTTPSSRGLAAVFEEKAPDQIEWSFLVTPKTDHFKNAASGLHEAFMALFPAWEFAKELTAAATSKGAEGVARWFSGKEASLGWRFKPAWFDLSVAAMGLARDGHADAALAVMAEMRRHYPDSAYVASFSASVYQMSGKPDEAAAELTRAIALAKEHGLDPNAIQIESLEARRDRIAQTR